MSIFQKIFAYNTGAPISGTTQVGDIAISEADVEYSANFGGLQWWGGPDETLGYVIAHTDPSGSHNGQPGIPAYLGFWRSNGLSDSDFLNLCNSIPPRIGFPPFTNTNDAYTWLNSNGYWTSYIPVTLTPTPTNNVTPTPTVTTTPTLTPTPSSTPTPVTGYSFNLVADPYNFPTSGNCIMNNSGGITSGSTDVNVLATGGRGFYINAIDSNSVDRTNYYSAFTGHNVTITLTQTGSTAIYSGDTNSFKQWIQSPQGSGFVFGANVGVPPSGTPSGTAILVQSATTQFTIGVPVYVSLVLS